MLKVLSPADDLSLISIEALRVAAGLASDDDSRDAELELLGLRLSAEIGTACRIATGNGGEPTLRQEQLEETFRFPRTGALLLSRRHKVEVESVSIDGQTLNVDNYWVDEESGILRRVSASGSTIGWCGRLVSVFYRAGFADVPADLAGAVADLARIRLSEASRDPMVRGESTEVPDVLTRRTDYWVGTVPGGNAGGLPASVSSQLRRYKNVAMV